MGGEAQEHVAQRNGRYPILGDIQIQDTWGSDQPDPAVGASVHCRGPGLGGLYVPIHTIL